MTRDDEDWFVCPNCGEVLVGDPTRCSRCGSDEETGWSEETLYDGVELDGDFDYDAFVREELEPHRGARDRSAWVVVVVLVMIGALVAMLVL
jgi:hypothetical protein